MEIYAYLRVSGAGQITGHGFERQRETIEAFCKSQGYKIRHIYNEQASGTTAETDRPAFTAMVAAILQNGVDTVVVESLDRFAREYRTQEQLLVYLASKKINLISANTGENITRALTGDPMKKAMVQMQGVFAELEKSMLVRKLRKAREKVRQERGKCEGRPGYSDPHMAEVVKEVKRLRRRRKGRRRRTAGAIANLMNESGHKTSTGKQFTPQIVRNIIMKSKR